MILSLETKQCSFHQYWTIHESIENYTEDYCIKRLLALLTESTRLRMMAADVPIGSFLSGGIDSSGITALARPMVDYEFHTFTACFGDDNPDSDYARTLSDTLDTAHHEVRISVPEVIRDFDRITWHFDEPLGDAAIIANYYLSQAAKRFVKVVLAEKDRTSCSGGIPVTAPGLHGSGGFHFQNSHDRPSTGSFQHSPEPVSRRTTTLLFMRITRPGNT